jgi:hypothetical protein
MNNLKNKLTSPFIEKRYSLLRGVFLLTLFTLSTSIYSQSCEEYKNIVKRSATGTTYYSYTSSSISEVTFYTLSIDYQNYHYAIVCFKTSFGCSEYIYQVSSDTEINYSIHYLRSAGEAYWAYIHPYRSILGCSPSFN